MKDEMKTETVYPRGSGKVVTDVTVKMEDADWFCLVGSFVWTRLTQEQRKALFEKHFAREWSEPKRKHLRAQMLKDYASLIDGSEKDIGRQIPLSIGCHIAEHIPNERILHSPCDELLQLILESYDK